MLLLYLSIALFRTDCIATMSETAAIRTAGRGGIQVPAPDLENDYLEWEAVLAEEQFIRDFIARYGRPPKFP